eukprot:CCRYP_021186-RA/>CCRYP_021186-RA protein AED:0.29 eAED:0.29 QI:222/1/1/1/0/0/2/109/153
MNTGSTNHLLHSSKWCFEDTNKVVDPSNKHAPPKIPLLTNTKHIGNRKNQNVKVKIFLNPRKEIIRKHNPLNAAASTSTTKYSDVPLSLLGTQTANFQFADVTLLNGSQFILNTPKSNSSHSDYGIFSQAEACHPQNSQFYPISVVLVVQNLV